MQSAGVEPTTKHHTFKVKGSNSVSAADNGEKKYKSIKTPKLKRDERDMKKYKAKSEERETEDYSISENIQERSASKSIPSL